MSFNFICDILKFNFLKEWWVAMPEKLEEEYLGIVQDILDNEEFQSLKNIITIIPQYTSILLEFFIIHTKWQKVLELDFEAVARGGLLHDFFLMTGESIKK